MKCSVFLQTQTQQWLNYFQTSSLGTSLKTIFPARQLLASSSFMTSEASRERTREWVTKPRVSFHVLLSSDYSRFPQMESLLTRYPLDRVLTSYLTRGEKGYKILNHNVLLHDKMQLISCAPQKPVSFYKTGRLFISILSKKIQHPKAQHVNG